MRREKDKRLRPLLEPVVSTGQMSHLTDGKTCVRTFYVFEHKESFEKFHFVSTSFFVFTAYISKYVKVLDSCGHSGSYSSSYIARNTFGGVRGRGFPQ